MQSTFDFGAISHEYDAYYRSNLGQNIDKLEKAIIADFLKKLATKNIFEIGCGTGHWSDFFAQSGFSVTAMDISEEMLKIAKSKNIKNVVFKPGDVLNLENADESVENIAAITSLEFSGDLEKAFEEIYRVLKPSGYFICAGLNGSSDFWNDKKDDPVYKNARFLSYKLLQKHLSKFGTPQINACVIVENNTFCDEKYTVQEKLNKGAFIAAMVQKK